MDNNDNLPPQRMEDARLVARMLANDEMAWREFYQRYVFELTRFLNANFALLRHMKGAEEVCAELCLVLLAPGCGKGRLLEAYDPAQASLLTWLRVIATRLALKWCGQMRREPLAKEEPLVDSPVDPSSPDSLLVAKEMVQRLQFEIPRMPPHLRPVARLVLEGKSSAQIAKQLGLRMQPTYHKVNLVRLIFRRVLLLL